ncbi:MAG TPA: glycosyltransferase family 39 protein, partial [Solirubrobacteraceae bacterium]|nr:glycosyltransferase family 39 protein [Solirubrobacteraceae bacterium]
TRPLWRPRETTAAQRRARAALFALLALTALACLWNLGASGDANSFYAAAVQAGTRSWKAFFFGSLDSSSFITTDKPPASIWVMALSGRAFGFSSWSMLVPQALEGVAAVALLYAAVRRWFGSAAGLGAGLVLALTPVAALMFRFNNPDALLVMLLVASAYCLTRAIESAGTGWIVATGTLLGFAFLTKMGQALIVVPAFGGAYLLAAPATFRRRMRDCVAGLVAMIVAGGWWVAIVALLPASSRPFVDGSPDNSILNLIFGYNGLQRLFGSGSPGPGGGGGGGGASFSGSSGTLRLFNDIMGGQASWLIPAAVIATVAGLWATRSAPRTDRTRAALIVWGGWLLVTAAVFSYSQGIIHTYYTVALAPAIGALVAIGAHMLWQRREGVAARLCAAFAIAVTGAWSYVLLDRTPSWEPWIRVLVVVATVVAVLAIVASLLEVAHIRRVALVGVIAAAVAGLAGPAAYAIQTVSVTHAGSTPSAGPTASDTLRAFGGRRGSNPGGVGRFGGESGAPPAGAQADGPPAGAGFGPPSGGRARGGFAGGPGGGISTVGVALVKALESNASSYRWVAATDGSMSAASYELASGGEPVMAIGGFNGNGGNLSLAAFIRYVRAGEIHYFIGGAGGFGGGIAGPSGSSSTIASWVASHYSAQTIAGVTVYDLAAR